MESSKGPHYNASLHALVSRLDPAHPDASHLEAAFKAAPLAELTFARFIQNFAEYAVPSSQALDDLEKLQKFTASVRRTTEDEMITAIAQEHLPQKPSSYEAISRLEQAIGKTHERIADRLFTGETPERLEYERQTKEIRAPLEAFTQATRAPSLEESRKQLRTSILDKTSSQEILQTVRESKKLLDKSDAEIESALDRAESSFVKIANRYTPKLASFEEQEQRLNQLKASPRHSPQEKAKLDQEERSLRIKKHEVEELFSLEAEAVKMDLLKRLGL